MIHVIKHTIVFHSRKKNHLLLFFFFVSFMVRDIYLVYANLEFSLEDRYKVRNKNRITLKFVLFLQFLLLIAKKVSFIQEEKYYF